MWVKVRTPQHQLDLKDEPLTLLKTSDRPFKNCEEFILRLLEAKSGAWTGKIGVAASYRVRKAAQTG
jgi:hypothetical protein